MSSAPKQTRKQNYLVSPVKKVVKSNKGEDFTSGFDKVKELGKGAFGVVNAVKRRSDGKMFAEKVFVSGDPDINEIDILSRIDHPNILKASAKFIDGNDKIHLLLPLADSDLTEFIDENPSVLDEPEHLNKVIYMMYELISAVYFLHSIGVYHCDIKPQNVLIKDGRVLLADFGWTFPQEYDTEDVCGTMGYASPQGWQDHPKDPFYDGKLSQIQSDIHALGAVFYQMIADEQLIWPLFSLSLKGFDQAYKNATKTVENVIKSVHSNQAMTSEQQKRTIEALECIEKMIQPKQEERFKSLQEVLNCKVFKSFGEPIKGIVKEIQLENVSCNSYQGIPIKNIMFTLMSYVMELDVSHIKAKWMKDSPLKIWCLTLSLLYRTLNVIKPLKIELQSFGLACYYAVLSCIRAPPITMRRLVAYTAGQSNEEQMKAMINKVIVAAGGIINVDTIYDHTDNALEIIWWLMNAMADCKFALDSMKNLDVYMKNFKLREKQWLSKSSLPVHIDVQGNDIMIEMGNYNIHFNTITKEFLIDY